MSGSKAATATVFTPSLLLLMWAAINLMDVLLTFRHMSWGGLEANPWLALVQSALGPVPMLAAKMTGALILGLLLTQLGRSRQLTVASAGMSLVVIYNAILVPMVLLA